MVILEGIIVGGPEVRVILCQQLILGVKVEGWRIKVLVLFISFIIACLEVIFICFKVILVLKFMFIKRRAMIMLAMVGYLQFTRIVVVPITLGFRRE